MTDEILINDYETYLKEELEYTSNTIINYKNDIIDFKEFLVESRLGQTLLDLRKPTPRRYIAYLEKNDVNSQTIATKISALRSFYDFLKLNEDIQENYFTIYKAPKQIQPLQNNVKLHEVRFFISSIDTSTDLGKRNKVIMQMLYYNLLKVKELVDLDVNDIDFDEHMIYVRTNSTLKRVVPLHKDSVEDLKNYLRFVRPHLLIKSQDMENRYLFINYKGTTLTDRGVRKIIDTLLEKVEADYNISPQILRDSFAKELINNGADTKSVLLLLGLKDLPKYHNYNNKSKEELKEIFLNAHPRGKKRD